MNFENYFKDTFESIPDYRNIVLLFFLNRNDKDLLEECGFLKNDSNRLSKEYKNILMEQDEQNLDHIKTKKKVLLKRFQISKWNNILL